MDGYLTKPIRAEELDQMLEQYAGRGMAVVKGVRMTGRVVRCMTVSRARGRGAARWIYEQLRLTFQGFVPT
jgi:L-amino acid N-acyltransferase YncA